MKQIPIILGVIFLSIELFMIFTVTAESGNFILMKIILPILIVALFTYGAFAKGNQSHLGTKSAV